VILEGDALEIIMALGRLEDEAGKYDNLIMDARRMFRGIGRGILAMLGVMAIW
jgi:hypothetical protein